MPEAVELRLTIPPELGPEAEVPEETCVGAVLSASSIEP
jgi:hypothetical protein